MLLTFATFVFLAGVVLGCLVRLSVLIGTACGLIVAILLVAVVRSMGFGGAVPFLGALLTSIVSLQTGYGCGVIARGTLFRPAVSLTPGEEVHDRPQRLSRDSISPRGERHIDHVPQDWSSRNQP